MEHTLKIENRKIIWRAWFHWFHKIIITVLLRGSLLLVPLFYGRIIDYAAASNFSASYTNIIILFGIVLCSLMFRVINDWSYSHLMNNLYRGFDKLIMRHAKKAPVQRLTKVDLGQYANIVNTDILIISEVLATLVWRIVIVFELVYIFALFLSIDVYIGAASLVSTGICILLFIISSKWLQKSNQQLKEDRDVRLGVYNEVYMGIKEIKSLSLFPIINKRIARMTKDFLESLLRFRLKAEVVRSSSFLIMEIVRHASLAYGILLIARGETTIGSVVMIYAYFSLVIGNFESVIAMNQELKDMKVSYRRIEEIMAEDDESETCLIKKVGKYRGKIEFDEVSYGTSDVMTLENVSFEIEPNTITVITGGSGAGKTGVVELLTKLNPPTTGDIKIDNASIEEFDDEVYYDLVSLVQKDAILFSMTVRENLQMVEPNFKKVVKACKKLKIHEYIMSLPDGYDTVISPGYDNIGSEIKNMLSVARILLKAPKTIILDETTSVFAQKEKDQIVSILMTMKLEHNIIIVSREEEVLERSDKVILLEDGKVKDVGTHKTLKKKHKDFEDIYI